jgi:exopolysaccharide biosynthesis polyprenyl glycosylphosphotransferase
MRQLFRVFIPAGLVGLFLSEIILIFCCYLAGSWLVGHYINPTLDLQSFVLEGGGLIQIMIVVVCLAGGFYFQNLYATVRFSSLTLLVQQSCLVIGLAFLVQAFLAYVRRPEWGLPRWAMIFGSILALIVIPTWRLFYGRVLIRVMGSRRVLFLGTSPISLEVAAHLRTSPETGMSVLGFIDDCTEAEALVSTEEMLGRVEDLTRVAEAIKPDLIVVGMGRQKELPLSEMLKLRFAGVRFEDSSATFETTFGRVSTRDLRAASLIFSADIGPRKGSLFWHSLYTTPIAALLSILFAPIMLVVALTVKLSSPGHVFHRQVRVGLNGSHFTVYKFRSMYIDAEARTGAVWAQKDDPRVTPAGKWIRRFRLDELPQLLNVLRGEMALVGPRPERPQFVDSLSEKLPYYTYRHCVKPGITGWAQINYKYGDTFEDAVMKLEYDLYYIKKPLSKRLWPSSPLRFVSWSDS